jgi:hypothetical protein
MVIVGEWLVCDDSITRPIMRVEVSRPDGSLTDDCFLVDTAADRTVLSAALVKKLQSRGNQAPPGVSLQGIGGASPHILVTTILTFTRDDGGPVRFRGEFAAFTDPAATDLSILGRDVLDHFDVITSRRQNAVLLLSGNHIYQVTSAQKP